MKFRKKPVVIEAEQYREGELTKGVCLEPCLIGIGPHVHTIHGNQACELADGDWIIPEPDGEHYYPCRADIFDRTYEPCGS